MTTSELMEKTIESLEVLYEAELQARINLRNAQKAYDTAFTARELQLEKMRILADMMVEKDKT